MNLFSRLDELLDGNDEEMGFSLYGNRCQADRLVLRMETNLARAQQLAVRLIAAELALARELRCQLQRESKASVLIECLREEHARASRSKCAVKKSLRQLREGLEHACLLRGTILRWPRENEEARLGRLCRLFWRAYHRLCDLADESVDQFEVWSAAFQRRFSSPNHTGTSDSFER